MVGRILMAFGVVVYILTQYSLLGWVCVEKWGGTDVAAFLGDWRTMTVMGMGILGGAFCRLMESM